MAERYEREENRRRISGNRKTASGRPSALDDERYNARRYERRRSRENDYDYDEASERRRRMSSQRQDGSRQSAGSRKTASSRRSGNRRREDYYYEERQRTRRRRKKRHTGRNILIVLLLLILAAFGAVYAFVGRMEHRSLRDIVRNAGAGESGYTNFVLYGVDSRNGKMTEETHSDTIMIVSLNKRTKEIRLASVYRDTYLDNTNGEYRKATECYYFGGPARSISMLNKNLDLDIEDYITVDFGAVIEIVDALGGIELEITEEEMGYINGYCVENKEVTGVDYTPLSTYGYVHLDGIQALAYCRIRYTEGWDYKRTERQRTVLNLCFQKARQQGIPAIMSIANKLIPNISTSMGTVELLALASGMNSYTLGEQTGFPFSTAAADLSNAGDVVVPVTLSSNVSQLHDFLFGTTGYVPSDTVQQISAAISSNTGIY